MNGSFFLNRGATKPLNKKVLFPPRELESRWHSQSYKFHTYKDSLPAPGWNLETATITIAITKIITTTPNNVKTVGMYEKKVVVPEVMLPIINAVLFAACELAVNIPAFCNEVNARNTAIATTARVKSETITTLAVSKPRIPFFFMDILILNKTSFQKVNCISLHKINKGTI